MTPLIRSFFSTLDARLPEDFIQVLDKEDNIVFVADLNAQSVPVKVCAYHSYPVLGKYNHVDIARDWGRDNKVWFRKRPLYNGLSFTSVKYECLISYSEDYRPQFEVDLTAPIFSLSLSTN